MDLAAGVTAGCRAAVPVLVRAAVTELEDDEEAPEDFRRARAS